MGQQQKTTWIGFIRHFGAEVSLTKSWAPALGFKLGAPDGDFQFRHQGLTMKGNHGSLRTSLATQAKRMAIKAIGLGYPTISN